MTVSVSRDEEPGPWISYVGVKAWSHDAGRDAVPKPTTWSAPSWCGSPSRSVTPSACTVSVQAAS